MTNTENTFPISSRILLTTPLVIGGIIPWAFWKSMGWIDVWPLTIASFAMAGLYLTFVHHLGNIEDRRRKELGRRYDSPSMHIVVAVCFGLTFSLLVPGLSAKALIDHVGLPRAIGSVSSYSPSDLARTGAVLRFSLDAMPRNSGMELLGDGVASFSFFRWGRPVSFLSKWTPREDAICISEAGCLQIEKESGRVLIGGVHTLEIGRIVSASPRTSFDSSIVETPWEMKNIFRHP